MRRFFGLIAALTLFGLLTQTAYSNDLDRGSLQDVLEYASNFAREGDSTRAIVVYDMMLRAFARSGNPENLSIACDALVANVPPEDIEKFNRSFWHCPEPLLRAWLGSIELYRFVNPQLVQGTGPQFPAGSNLDEGFVDVVFDVTIEGKVENIQVVQSTDPVWEQPVIDALQHWRFSPALEEGQPVHRFDHRQRFTFKIVE